MFMIYPKSISEMTHSHSQQLETPREEAAATRRSEELKVWDRHSPVPPRDSLLPRHAGSNDSLNYSRSSWRDDDSEYLRLPPISPHGRSSQNSSQSITDLRQYTRLRISEGMEETHGKASSSWHARPSSWYPHTHTQREKALAPTPVFFCSEKTACVMFSCCLFFKAPKEHVHMHLPQPVNIYPCRRNYAISLVSRVTCGSSVVISVQVCVYVDVCRIGLETALPVFAVTESLQIYHLRTVTIMFHMF